ncbi:MAG: hypothetical protein COB53_01425 [Elusimicrobia bacterium]|nr:MAG: hypothetical protein COB53_01425 [Elusimicrobiota bacterium]
MINRRTNRKLWTSGIAAIAILGFAASAHADAYDRLSDKISQVAKKTSHIRIAILPFKPINGRSRQGGMILAERLVSRLASTDGIEVVERTLLNKVLEEQQLGVTGALDQRQAKEVGRILGVDALVTGTYMPLSKERLEVHARLIDAESARILGVAMAKVRKEWQDDSFAIGEMWNVVAPKIENFPTPLAKLFPKSSMLPGLSDLRDAPRSRGPCDNWQETVDTLQSKVLAIKARFWATRLNDPMFNRRTVTRNPGSEIRNKSLRTRFYDQTRDLHKSGYNGGITMAETVKLENVKAQVDRLIDKCY